MQTFQDTLTIARPVGEVFAFLADLRNIPRWNYAIARTVPTSPGPAGVGATYRQTRTIPRRSEESLQITVFQPPTRLAVQGELGPFRATASYLLEPALGGRHQPAIRSICVFDRPDRAGYGINGGFIVLSFYGALAFVGSWESPASIPSSFESRPRGARIDANAKLSISKPACPKSGRNQRPRSC
jgi:hypothetical protein